MYSYERVFARGISTLGIGTGLDFGPWRRLGDHVPGWGKTHASA